MSRLRDAMDIKGNSRSAAHSAHLNTQETTMKWADLALLRWAIWPPEQRETAMKWAQVTLPNWLNCPVGRPESRRTIVFSRTLPRNRDVLRLLSEDPPAYR